MICTACGAENRTGSKFCDQCAAPLASTCPACGEPNRADARFCASCAKPLAEAPAPAATQTAPGPSAERRYVSVLFADLVGFTSFADGRDPEQVRALQSRYFDAASEAIARHGGTVEKFIGDAVMAVWGTPIAHEDDAQRAVRAGLEVVDAVRALGHDLDARAGVVTGEAAVSIGATNQGMVAGDMVNTASRLQSSAGHGDVLADQSTVQAASATIVFEPVDERQLKGKAEAMRAWRAVRVLAARSSDGLVEPPFVGRANELRRMKELLHAVGREQRIRLASITGAAGIGKSRLIEELGVYADGIAEDVWWHTGRSPSYGEGIAFWALGEMIRQRAGLAETDDAETTAERVAATVEEFVSDAAEREWIAPALLALLGVNADPAEGESLFPAWRTFFERVAQRGTTVLVFEDLQWADSGTLDFVEHLLDWSRAQPMFVVTLARPELLDTRAGWGSGRGNSTAMALEPMADAEMRELLGGMLPGLPDATIGPIIGRAGGMPLYAVEMVRALLADGRIERQGDAFVPTGDLESMPIPVSLRSLIASRLDALSPEDRTLLQHGAVLGLAFGADALASVSGSGPGELEPRLRGLVRRELLEIEADPRSPERGQYRFVQSLIREVAYDTLAMRERRARHLAAARHLEAAESDEAAGALATHYLAAYRASEEGPEADAVGAQARVSLRAAADRAATLGAHEQAVKNLEHALTITTDVAERAQLLERAAASAGVAALSSAPDFARQAVEAYRAIGDAQGSLRATSTVADVLLDAGQVSEADDVLAKAIADLTDADSAGEGAAMLYAMQARSKMRLDANDEAIAAADRALELGERLELPLVIATAIINKGSTYVGVGRRTEAVALLRAGVELAEAGGWPHLELRARGNLGQSISDDSPSEALETWDRALSTARRIGDRMTFQFAAMLRASMLQAQGEPKGWAEADQLLDEAEPLARPGVERAFILSVRILLASLRGLEVGDLLTSLDADVRDATDRRAPLLPHLTRAVTSWAGGRWTDSIRESRLALGIDSWAVIDLSGMLSNAALRTGDRVVVDELLALAEDHPETSAWSTAMRRHVTAISAAATGDRDEALELFAEALERYAQLGCGVDWGICALNALLVAPEDARARGWAEEARARFAALDAAPLVAMLGGALAAGASAASFRAEKVDAPAISA